MTTQHDIRMLARASYAVMRKSPLLSLKRYSFAHVIECRCFNNLHLVEEFDKLMGLKIKEEESLRSMLIARKMLPDTPTAEMT